MENDNKKPYVLVSVFKDDAKPESIAQSAPAISLIIDEWHNSGRMIWSGSFDDNKTAMSVIEATKPEAEEFYAKYSNATNAFLSTYMYQWDAMPLLSLIGNMQNNVSLQVTPEQQWFFLFLSKIITKKNKSKNQWLMTRLIIDNSNLWFVWM